MIVAGAVFQTANAQVRVNINIGMQPAWGPAGYDYAEYYYMPAMDMYYYIPGRQYIYLSGGRWIRTTYLPARWRGHDFYRTYKVVINDRDPFRYHDRYRMQYAKYRGRHDQLVIRDWHKRNNNHGVERRTWDNNNRSAERRTWNNNNNRSTERRTWNGNNRSNERSKSDNNRGNSRGKGHGKH